VAWHPELMGDAEHAHGYVGMAPDFLVWRIRRGLLIGILAVAALVSSSATLPATAPLRVLTRAVLMMSKSGADLSMTEGF